MCVSVVQKIMKVHNILYICNMAESVKRKHSSTWIVLLGRGWGMRVYPPYLPTTNEKNDTLGKVSLFISYINSTLFAQAY